MIDPIIMSYVFSLVFLLLLFVVKVIYDRRRIAHLQKQIQELRDCLTKGKSTIEKNGEQIKRREILERQYELFVTTQTYRDLCLLYELRSDQIVNEQTRSDLVRQVLAAYYDGIAPMLENGEFQQEEIFVGLMYFMGFRTRQIAACLGLTVEAIRKRKSRLRQKLDDTNCDFFPLNGVESAEPV